MRARLLLLIVGALGCSTPTPSATDSRDAAAAVVSPTAPIGVRECDAFVAAVRACAASQTGAARDQMLSAITDDVRSWRDAAARPGGHAAIAETCARTFASTKPSLRLVGCDVGDPPAPASLPASGPAFLESGVAECDDFMRRYAACLEAKLPAAARADIERGLADSSQVLA